VPRLDGAGVDRADRDLVDAVALDADEGIGVELAGSGRSRVEILAQGEASPRPRRCGAATCGNPGVLRRGCRAGRRWRAACGRPAGRCGPGRGRPAPRRPARPRAQAVRGAGEGDRCSGCKPPSRCRSSEPHRAISCPPTSLTARASAGSCAGLHAAAPDVRARAGRGSSRCRRLSSQPPNKVRRLAVPVGQIGRDEQAQHQHQGQVQEHRGQGGLIGQLGSSVSPNTIGWTLPKIEAKATPSASSRKGWPRDARAWRW
jgi:hypothetical protein